MQQSICKLSFWVAGGASKVVGNHEIKMEGLTLTPNQALHPIEIALIRGGQDWVSGPDSHQFLKTGTGLSPDQTRSQIFGIGPTTGGNRY
ncbi:hypothetical protein V6N11_073044 [Hibiscus sabdariffa]|uniref:Uncharacterized protein n=2 Tax=Hibiscus sabdariffa TaxID=183260 RepID=A0ABR2NX09_9ROSI